LGTREFGGGGEGNEVFEFAKHVYKVNFYRFIGFWMGSKKSFKKSQKVESETQKEHLYHYEPSQNRVEFSKTADCPRLAQTLWGLFSGSRDGERGR